MRVIIAGSRGIVFPKIVEAAVKAAAFPIDEVVSGTARGADILGEWWARKNGVKVTQFPALWTEYGKSAGFLRNVEMAKYADALIALWDGTSRGTQHMIQIAQEHNLPTFVYNIRERDDWKDPWK